MTSRSTGSSRARNHDTLRPESVDVAITDDNTPGVLIQQSNNSTNVTEATTSVVLGTGFVTGTRAALDLTASTVNANHISSLTANTPAISVQATP